MQCIHYEEEDAIHINVRDGTSSETRQLDERRYLGFNDDGALVWVSFAQYIGGRRLRGCIYK